MITIEHASNGYVLVEEFPNSEETSLVHVFEDNVEDPLQPAVSLLYAVAEALGVLGSRHDSQRIRIVLEPGDKYEELNTSSGAV